MLQGPVLFAATAEMHGRPWREPGAGREEQGKGGGVLRKENPTDGRGLMHLRVPRPFL